MSETNSCSQKDCNNQGDQKVDFGNYNEYYCKDHYKYCSCGDCENLAIKVLDTKLGHKDWPMCEDHEDDFDDGEDGQTIECRGDKCRRKILYSEHKIWCISCHGHYDPWWNSS